MSTYAIYSEGGQELSQVIAADRAEARRVAQTFADQMDQTVYLDTVPSSTDPDNDEDTGEAIEPSTTALTLDQIDALGITASDARPSDTDAADGVDVTITVSGEPVGTITGTVTVTPMASGQGYAANAQSLDTWIAAGPLLDLLEAQPARERRELAQAIEMAASRAAK